MTGDSPHHLRKSIQLLIWNARSLRVHRVAQSFRRDRVGVLRMLDHLEDLHLMNCTATQERAGGRGVRHRAQANCRQSPWNNVLKQSPLHVDLLGASSVMRLHPSCETPGKRGSPTAIESPHGFHEIGTGGSAPVPYLISVASARPARIG